MAIKYTYDDFKKALDTSGLQASFSDYDMRLAEKDPSAGMSLIRYKSDYKNAKTDEARALANEGAESVRRTYGGYTGGGDGSGYYLETPSSFRYDKQEPVYKNQYGAEAQSKLTDILDYANFRYKPENDPAYEAYAKQYAREGKRASEDTLGAAAAASGGIPSSYAVTAASQAGDYYAAQMSDKIPELYNAAYDRYLSEYNKEVQKYKLLQEAENNDYSRYLDELTRYDAAKADAYNKHLTSIKYHDTREASEKQAEEKAAQQQFENALALRNQDREDRVQNREDRVQDREDRVQDREDSELERRRAADLVDAEIRRGQLELDKTSDSWKKDVALGDLDLQKESLAWEKAYGTSKLAQAAKNSGGTSGGYTDEGGGKYTDEEDESGDGGTGSAAAPLDASTYNTLLRKVSNQATEDEKVSYVWSLYTAGTINDADAERLLKDAGVDTSKFNG